MDDGVKEADMKKNKKMKKQGEETIQERLEEDGVKERNTEKKVKKRGAETTQERVEEDAVKEEKTKKKRKVKKRGEEATQEGVEEDTLKEEKKKKKRKVKKRGEEATQERVEEDTLKEEKKKKKRKVKKRGEEATQERVEEDTLKEEKKKKKKKVKKRGEEATQERVEEVIVKKMKKVEPPECAPDTEEELELDVFNTECRMPVYDMQVYNKFIFVCSGDSVRAYSLLSKECKKVFEGHTEAVKCLLVSALPDMPAPRLYTGSYDKTVRRYSIKLQKCLKQTSLPHRVLCLHIAWNILYVGVDDGSVFSFNMKTLKQLDVFKCHSVQGGVTCMSTDQEGPQPILVTGSYDGTISVCDAKSGLVLRTLQAERAVLCLKVVNDLVFSGSNGGTVHAHNIHNGELINIYKGHGHAITSIAIFGKFMVTASLDGLIDLHELQSHAVLEVYRSPRVMVSSMAVHKGMGMIYIGFYDGSVRAVAKLDLK